MEFNKIFEDIGQFGPYQCAMALILAGSMAPAAFSNLNVVFIMGVTDYWCDVPQLYALNCTEEEIKYVTIPKEYDEDGNFVGYSQCEMYDRNYTGWTKADVEEYLSEDNLDNATAVACMNDWIFDTEVYGNTATTDWSLVCNQRWWQAASASFFAFGMFAALLVYGTLADLFGRKPVLCGSYILFIIANFATAFAWNYQFLTATRFLSGFFSAPFYGGTLVLLAEIIGPDWRGHVNAWFGYVWSVTGILLAGLAYAIQDWRTLQYVLSALMIVFCVFFLLPESPRWLYIKGRKSEGDKIFKRIAKSNKRKFDPEKVVWDDVGEASETNAYLWDMFRGKALAIRSTVAFWNWFAASLCYYGLTLNATSLGGNEYLSFILSMLVEVPGMMICHYVSVKVGRRWPLAISMAISGIALFLTLAFEEGSIPLISLVSFGKMTITLAFNLLYVYMVELYPTVIRSVASSAGNFAARLGSILAPFIAQLSDFAAPLPLIIFGICALSAGLVAILLPETIGIDLEDSLEPSHKQVINESAKDDESSDLDNEVCLDDSKAVITKL